MGHIMCQLGATIADHLLQQRPVLHQHVFLLQVVLRAQRLDLLLDAPLLWRTQNFAFSSNCASLPMIRQEVGTTVIKCNQRLR
jgi:hypothetical protein